MPPILRGLTGAARRTARQAPEAGGGRARLAALGPDDRAAEVRDLVLRQAAAALGRSGPEEVAPRQPFQELGLDSLRAVFPARRHGHAAVPAATVVGCMGRGLAGRVNLEGTLHRWEDERLCLTACP